MSVPAEAPQAGQAAALPDNESDLEDLFWDAFMGELRAGRLPA